jgi:hypothetical protein
MVDRKEFERNLKEAKETNRQEIRLAHGSRPGKVGRDLPLPSMRACALFGFFAGIFNFFVLSDPLQKTGGRAVVAVIFGFFVFGGTFAVTAIRRRFRPEQPTDTAATNSPVDPEIVKPKTGAPSGGWANPTSGQKFVARIRRLFLPNKR